MWSRLVSRLARAMLTSAMGYLAGCHGAGVNTTVHPSSSPPAHEQVDGLEMFNVKAFGAKGDGQTDDTQAIQDAIAAIAPQGGVVYLPVGVYRTTRPILLKPQLRLMGATRRSGGDGPGSLGSRVSCDHEGHGFYLAYETYTAGNIMIEHLGLQGYNKRLSEQTLDPELREEGTIYRRGHGIYLKNVYDVTLSNVDASFFPEDNFHIHGGWHVYIRDCYSGHPGITNYHIEIPHNSIVKAVSDGGQYGLTLDVSGGAADVRGCHFEGCTVAGVRVTDAVELRFVTNVVPVVKRGIIFEGDAEFANIVANQFLGVGGEVSVAIDISNPKARRIQIANNCIKSFRIGIRDAGAGSNVISGNIIDSPDREGIGIEMTPAPGALPSVVSANVIQAGNTGIRHVDGHRITYVGNTMVDFEGRSVPITVLKGEPTVITNVPQTSGD